MAQSAGLHEPEDRLSTETINRHRALTSIQEEFEAVDWYAQRVDATDDAELGTILGHNRDEEKEHAVMTLEWLRRHDPVLDEHMRTYLFTSEPVTEIEHEAEDHGDGGEAESGSLSIGGLRGRS